MQFYSYAPEPVYVHDADQIDGLVRQCLDTNVLGVDTETLGLFDKKKYGSKMTDEVVVMSLCPSVDQRILVPRRFLPAFAEVLESEHVIKAIHNAKFDMHRLANAGLSVGGPIADTLHLDWLSDEDTRENRHGLDVCMLDYFDMPRAKYKDVFGSEDPRKFRPGHEQWLKYLDYASLDAWDHRKLCLHLFEALENTFVEAPNWNLLDLYWDTEEPQLQCLYDMERYGITVDTAALHAASLRLQAEMDGWAAKLTAMVGRPINPASAQQMSEYVYGELGYEPLEHTPTGRPKFDEKAMKHFAAKGVKECELALAFKKCQKLKGTYTDGLLSRMYTDGRIHTGYSTTKLTGRLASSDPNLQNIPTGLKDTAGLRAMFIASPGHKLLVNDYSQLEFCLIAELGQDPKLAAAIAKGLDMHCYTASEMYGIPYDVMFRKAKIELDPEYIALRSAAKAIGFGIAYGKTAYGLARDFGITKEEAQARIDKFLNAFPGIRNYMQGMQAMARQYGYVQTIAGRFRRLSAIHSSNWRARGEAERQAINAPIQGSAHDVVKRAMILLHQDARLRELGFRLMLQVHDELVAEAPEENAAECAMLMQEIMEQPFSDPLSVPLTAVPTICNNWKEGK